MDLDATRRAERDYDAVLELMEILQRRHERLRTAMADGVSFARFTELRSAAERLELAVRGARAFLRRGRVGRAILLLESEDRLTFRLDRPSAGRGQL